MKCYWHLVGKGKGILECTGQFLTAKNYLVQHVNCAMVEKPFNTVSLLMLEIVSYSSLSPGDQCLFLMSPKTDQIPSVWC